MGSSTLSPDAIGILRVVVAKLARLQSLEFGGLTWNERRFGDKWVYACDYDPLRNLYLVEHLLSLQSERVLSVHYLDIDNRQIARMEQIQQDQPGDDAPLLEFSKKHVGLHDCTVEGSHFTTSPTHHWSIFYDALEDWAILFFENKPEMEWMKEGEFFLKATPVSQFN